MRRWQAGWTPGSIVLLCCGVLLSGCRPADEDEAASGRRSRGGSAPPVEVKLEELKGQDGKTGAVFGKIIWDDAVPDVSKEVNADKDTEYCHGKGPDAKGIFQPIEIQQQELRISDFKDKSQTLGNVFVWLDAPQGFYLEVTEKVLKSMPEKKVLSQPHCAFVPHCTFYVPRYYKGGKITPTGQKLVIENDAYKPHNASIQGGANQVIPAREGDTIISITPKLSPSTTPISISCSIHGWMRAYVGVYDHPFVALSSVGADLPKKVYENRKNDKFGAYRIEGAPLGQKVLIKAWHEKLGYLNQNGAEGQEITLTESLEVNFTAKNR